MSTNPSDPSQKDQLREAALEYHRSPTRGKIEVVPRIAITSLQDLRDVYVPGVARVCRAIEADPE